MSREHPPVADPAALERALGVALPPELLELALTHRSYAYEHDVPNNERLEFLGDSVLGRATTWMLYQRYPNEDEGSLAKRRSLLVSTEALAEIARAMPLGPHLRLGRGEELTGGRDKSTILADTVEALLGAAYVAFGSEPAERLVLHLVLPLADDPHRFDAAADPKTALQELANRLHRPEPAYQVTATGPQHAQQFTAVVTVGDRTGTGTGTSKRHAERAAALAAYRELAPRESESPTAG